MSKLRRRVWNKSEGKCWYCGDKLPIKGWHADHFRPIGREPGGTIRYPERDTEDNLVPSCAGCNIMKSNMDIEAFRDLITNFVVRLNRDITVFRHAKRYGLVEETGAVVTFWYENKEG